MNDDLEDLDYFADQFSPEEMDADHLRPKREIMGPRSIVSIAFSHIIASEIYSLLKDALEFNPALEDEIEKPVCPPQTKEKRSIYVLPDLRPYVSTLKLPPPYEFSFAVPPNRVDLTTECFKSFKFKWERYDLLPLINYHTILTVISTLLLTSSFITSCWGYSSKVEKSQMLMKLSLSGLNLSFLIYFLLYSIRWLFHSFDLSFDLHSFNPAVFDLTDWISSSLSVQPPDCCSPKFCWWSCSSYWFSPPLL